MQKFFASILLLCFFGQTFNQGFYYLDYMLQKNAYMERCVNKSLPEMHCDGKCLLMKKIEEQERKELGQPPEMKLAGKIDVLSPKSPFLLSFERFATDQNLDFIDSDMGTPIDHPSSIFHPPQVS